MPQVGDVLEKNGRIYVWVQPDPALGPGVWRTANPDEIQFDTGNETNGVLTVSSLDINSNGALTVSPTFGNVTVEINTASSSQYGVVELADSSDITDGTASKVVTADQLRDAIDNVDIDLTSTNGSITIDKSNAPTVNIDVKEGLFLFADFSLYPDVSTAP